MDKLYLVREEELNHLRNPQTASNLDMEIEKILNSHLNECEKVTQYNNILMKHLTMMNKERKPLEFKVSGVKDFHVYLNYLPKNIQKSSEIILDIISKNLKILDINDKSEIIFHERTISNSNIVDLLKKVLIKAPTKNVPIGLNEFQEALNTLNVPKSILNPTPESNYELSKKTLTQFVKNMPAKISPIHTRSAKYQSSSPFTSIKRKRMSEKSLMAKKRRRSEWLTY